MFQNLPFDEQVRILIKVKEFKDFNEGNNPWGKNVIAAVPTRTNGYINSGFLLMDLDKIRKEKFYSKWIKSSQEND